MPLEMSDVDSKSSSGSETKNSSANAGEDSLDFMQRMILVQQQHLISQYQCEKSNTSGVNEGKGSDDLITRIEREQSELRIINQQNSILKQIEKDNYSTSNGKVGSETTVQSKEKSPDSQQIPKALKDEPSLAHETTLSSSREIPKQKHLEDTLLGREISCRGGKSSQQEQADGNDQSESRSSAALSAIEIPYSSQDAWRRLESELEEYFSNVEIHDESIPHNATTAELKLPPNTLNGVSADADPVYDRLWRGSYPGQVPLPPVQSRSQVLPHILDREDEDDMDDRKPPADRMDDEGA